jgi:hypothetical protein
MVLAWPEVVHVLPAQLTGLPDFEHLETTLRPELNDGGRRVGEAVWLSTHRGENVTGIAWEWVEVRPGLVGLRDINGAVSNAKWISETGAEFDELTRIVVHNLILHSLPWQAYALAALDGRTQRSSRPGRVVDIRAGCVRVPAAANAAATDRG